MAYYVDTFSPETYERFLASDRTIAGFNDQSRTRSAMNRVRLGDKLMIYVTKAMRWGGILEVGSAPFRDEAPLFVGEDDPYINRFQVKPLVVLPLDKALSIRAPHIWDSLSFTKGHLQNSVTWTARIRNSLNRLEDEDGQLLEDLLWEAAPDVTPGAPAPPSPAPVDRVFSDVGLQPEVAQPAAVQPESEGRESIRIQAMLAEIGSRMGMSIWIPPNDRGRVQQHLSGAGSGFLEKLPFDYGSTTNRTIEQIDVLWLSGPSIRRAFEVEHTTAVYSGLLRMADLLALQSNLNIPLHIVAPSDRREKVLREIRRPAFSHFNLVERCSFISYESVQELQRDPNLQYLNPNVLARFEERAR